eukprot:CAMPEP_0198149498 /NCGR_PEP_ID=MMETSP1443-20131203/46881_1 /TAXON_ID=186043 /ORGANISM="Entomoneis sp., Strain CCMP2396" /LENGTH=67 /DNA_ID=CAMNT_0043814557 /DNA_START=108 /DNA_END=311 /DNA_ORIENTATION=-
MSEITDPMHGIREECKNKDCIFQKQEYDQCVSRITEKKFGDCEAWFFDWIKCADKCIAPKIFSATKE